MVVITTMILSAENLADSKNCKILTQSIRMMSKGTEINHENITMLAEILQNGNDKTKRQAARAALEEMNKKTKERQSDSEYPSFYLEIKKGFEVNCGIFTAENNATVNGMIERSIQFNHILAEVLGDKLSLSKAK